MNGRDSGPQPEYFMKKTIYPTRAFVAGIITGLVVLADSGRTQVVVGAGPDASYAIIEAEAFGNNPLVYEYRYDFDPSNPFDGYALFTAIDSADPGIEFGFVNFGDELDPNYFVNSITYGATRLVSTEFPNVGPFWAQWVSGGQAGFPLASPISSSVWSFGSGVSSPYRFVEPGSSDAFVFNDGDLPPSMDPVPEPSAAALIFGAALFVVIRWFHRGFSARARA